MTIGDESGFLVWRWRTDTGQVPQPGGYVFSGRLARGGRGTGGDSYSVTGDGEAGPVSSGGWF